MEKNTEVLPIPEKFELKDVKWRMLSLLDIKEFKAAAVESIASNYEFLGYGRMFESISSIEYVTTFTKMLFKDPIDHYGFFWQGKMLGHLSFGISFSIWGTELIGWVRNGFHNKGVGELGLSYSENVAFEHKKFNFVVLQIDEKNEASRKVAEKVGYKPVLKIPYSIGSKDCSVMYLKINPRIERIARQYGRRAIDIMNCPATVIGANHFLISDSIVEFYAWPFAEYSETMPPVNLWAFDAYCAQVNFSPDVLESQKALEKENEN